MTDTAACLNPAAHTTAIVPGPNPGEHTRICASHCRHTEGRKALAEYDATTSRQP